LQDGIKGRSWWRSGWRILRKQSWKVDWVEGSIGNLRAPFRTELLSEAKQRREKSNGILRDCCRKTQFDRFLKSRLGKFFRRVAQQKSPRVGLDFSSPRFASLNNSVRNGARKLPIDPSTQIDQST